MKVNLFNNIIDSYLNIHRIDQVIYNLIDVSDLIGFAKERW
jgi:hypothetical protein